jgi:hypothetical protein
MTGAGEGAATAAKILAVIKDLPLWLFAGLTLSASALLFFSGIASAVPASAIPWIIVTGVGSAGLQRLLGLGSYQTAWTILQKLRTAIVAVKGQLSTGEPFNDR